VGNPIKMIPTATGISNAMLQPMIIIMFTVVVICIVITVFLYIRVWVLAQSLYLIVKRTEQLATDYAKLSYN